VAAVVLYTVEGTQHCLTISPALRCCFILPQLILSLKAVSDLEVDFNIYIGGLTLSSHST
jgi:hypothetical protein